MENEENSNIDFEEQLEQAKQETARYEAEKLAAEAKKAALDRDIELARFAQHRDDSCDAALQMLNLTPHDRRAMLKLMQNGHCGIELRNVSGRCVVYLDGVENSMAGAIARYKTFEPTHFKQGAPEVSQDDPDEKIRSYSEFRSPEHRLAFIRKYGEERYAKLHVKSSDFYQGSAEQLSKSQYLALCREERLRAINELGHEYIERLLSGQPTRGYARRKW